MKPLVEAIQACCVACAFVRCSCVLRGHGVAHSSHTSTNIQGVDFM